MRRVLSMAVGVAFVAALFVSPLPSVSAAEGLFNALQDTAPARPLAESQLPYNGTFARPLPSGDNYSASGVAMRRIGGTLYDHPVAQAQTALSLLSSYRHNNDPEYLAMAQANADRLIDNAVTSRAALYFPYPFDFALHGGADVMQAPWYSGMAQGQALSAFIRLYQVTADPRYLSAAEGAFASFKNVRAAGTPWVVNIDDGGYAWFEEYADDNHPDFTFNGHGFAVYGLHEYYQLTGDADALALFRMGVATMKKYVEDIRDPGWVSEYCLTHRTASVTYHKVHIQILYMLHSMTGDSYFATVADAFVDDYPSPSDYGTGRFSAGEYDAHKFSSKGAVLERKAIALPDPATAAVGSRSKIAGQAGIWLRVDGGALAGYWVREVPGSAHIIGLALQRYSFDPLRLLRFKQGVYTGFTFAKNGDLLTSKRAGLKADSGAYSDMRALINGRTHYRITGGIWKDYWVPAEDRLSFKGTALTGA